MVFRRRFWSYSFLLFPLFFLCLPAPRAYAQASVNVSTLDPVYRDIDKLVAHGLIYKIIVGQRPYSRMEIARLTKEAMFNFEKLEKRLAEPELTEGEKSALQKRLQYIRTILDRLKRDYREELVQLGVLPGRKSWYSVHFLEKVDVDTLVTNSEPHALAPENGLGGIDAVINPLVNYRQGRHIVDGATLALESTHWLRATNYFAMLVQPRFQLGLAINDQPDDNGVFVQNLYGKFNFKNFEIEMGRDNLVYGQGVNAGILLSNNPRGLDMIKLSNDAPFFFPWVLKYIGANKISFFYADLGPEQNFPHAYLTGYKWSLQPISFVEVGASLLVQAGGEGSPPASFGDRVASLFGFNPEPEGHQVSNKIGGFDFRFRIPPLRGAELYGEVMFDDRHNNFFSQAQLIDDAAYVGGLYVPRANTTGSVDLRLEFHKTGNRFYRHGTWNSGWTLNRFLLGDNLGPDALGTYLEAHWDLSDRHLLGFYGAFESRSRDIWAVEDPFQFNFVKVEDFPDENRLRFVSDWLYRMKELPLEIRLALGYEHVWNFNYLSGNSRNNVLGEAGLRIYLDKPTRFPR